LHARVLRFARTSLDAQSGLQPPSAEGADDFERLACDIARLQADTSPGYARLVERRGSQLDSLDSIPAVPVETFRLTRVATHPVEDDVARFVTSGTTGSAAGTHVFRTLATYRELALAWGERALFSAWPGPKTVVALAPVPTEPPTSSLGFMMQTFMERFDGRALKQNATGVPFDGRSGARWLVTLSGLDVEGLRRAAAVARARSEPLFVLATAFTLVALLDALEGDSLHAPSRTVVMQTGGFKGRSREIAPDKLRAGVAAAFRVGETSVVGEYGMTELTSQLYEGTVPGAALAGPRGVYLEPPWLRVIPVDPSTLRPVPEGQPGIARIVDLGNVDSAVVVLTQDVVRRSGPGIELLGRRTGAPPRGCSLPFEGLLRGEPRGAR
jgi:acyl-CoA synthetase (AMP-forming)/AMP-acid ligase II